MALALGISTFGGLGMLVACGGKAIIDAPLAQGGAGGGPSCDALEQAVSAKNAAATVCNPLLNSVQCDGSEVVHDSCACSIVANEHDLDAVNAATQAYQAWTAAGCGPFACGTPCPTPGPTGCVPDGGNPSSGHCGALVF